MVPMILVPYAPFHLVYKVWRYRQFFPAHPFFDIVLIRNSKAWLFYAIESLELSMRLSMSFRNMKHDMNMI